MTTRERWIAILEDMTDLREWSLIRDPSEQPRAGMSELPAPGATPLRNRAGSAATDGNHESNKSPACRLFLTAIRAPLFAAEHPVDDRGVDRDNRQHEDTGAPEEKRQRLLRRRRVGNSDGVGDHVGPEHHH